MVRTVALPFGYRGKKWAELNDQDLVPTDGKPEAPLPPPLQVIGEATQNNPELSLLRDLAVSLPACFHEDL